MELPIQKNVPLNQYTTLNVGGVADYVVAVTSVEELEVACRWAEQTGMPPLILGGGSNVLLADAGYRGLVILLRSKGVTIATENAGAVLVRAEAGEDWDVLVQMTVEQNLSGLENLSGIPGTVGAAPVQNINAYGAAVADTIVSVEVYDYMTKSFRTLSVEECQFGYRDSIFKHTTGAALIVTAVTFKLVPAVTANLVYRSASQSIERYLAERNITTPTPLNVRDAVLQARSNIGMLIGQFRSAGSFFKNTIVSAKQFSHIEQIVNEQYAELGAAMTPWHWALPGGEVKISTAFLMECSPYNKRTYGEQKWNGVVGISPKHSLSIVTYDAATAADVIDFANEITTAIKNIFDITIESEVNITKEK